MKLEANPRQLREPDTKPLGNGLFEIRTMGADIARGIWVYQSGERIFFYFGSLSKKSPKKRPPAEIDQALRRLEEMQNEI
uniref:Toxin HigB n=1 Tax=Klebsiella pneumoniae TaxID=573 RepID=A0A8B0STV7_KLEPN|nr:Toxin HigB [Klebsiella pneumoniae]